MSINWLEGTDNRMEEPGRAMAMPVFAGQKLVVVGGSSGMGRQTAADAVAGPQATQTPAAGRRHQR
jgi:hypothetical protein